MEIEFRSIVLDFDSTLIQGESLEILARISLSAAPNASKILQQIQSLTAAAMEGRISFQYALQQRIQLLQASAYHLPPLIDILKQQYTPSLLRNRQWLFRQPWKIYVLSSGFIEFILPVLHPLGFLPEQIFANRFVADAHGKIIGVDPSLPLAHDHGKVSMIKQLAPPSPILVIGDGYNDYEIRHYGLAECFAAFTENAYRPAVVNKADYILRSFDDLSALVQQISCLQ